jgi:hypothetical protein
MPATWAWAAAKRLGVGSPQTKVILQVKLKVEAFMEFAVTGVALNAIVLEARISRENLGRFVGYLLQYASNQEGCVRAAGG